MLVQALQLSALCMSYSDSLFFKVPRLFLPSTTSLFDDTNATSSQIILVGVMVYIAVLVGWVFLETVVARSIHISFRYRILSTLIMLTTGVLLLPLVETLAMPFIMTDSTGSDMSGLVQAVTPLSISHLIYMATALAAFIVLTGLAVLSKLIMFSGPYSDSSTLSINIPSLIVPAQPVLLMTVGLLGASRTFGLDSVHPILSALFICSIAIVYSVIVSVFPTHANAIPWAIGVYTFVAVIPVSLMSALHPTMFWVAPVVSVPLTLAVVVGRLFVLYTRITPSLIRVKDVSNGMSNVRNDSEDEVSLPRFITLSDFSLWLWFTVAVHKLFDAQIRRTADRREMLSTATIDDKTSARRRELIGRLQTLVSYACAEAFTNGRSRLTIVQYALTVSANYEAAIFEATRLPTMVERDILKGLSPITVVMLIGLHTDADRIRRKQDSGLNAEALAELNAKQKKAKEEAINARRAINSFWRALAIPKPDVNELLAISQEIHKHSTTADKLYIQLIKAFPERDNIIHAYADFVAVVQQDPEYGAQIQAAADEIANNRMMSDSSSASSSRSGSVSSGTSRAVENDILTILRTKRIRTTSNSVSRLRSAVLVLLCVITAIFVIVGGVFQVRMFVMSALIDALTASGNMDFNSAEATYLALLADCEDSYPGSFTFGDMNTVELIHARLTSSLDDLISSTEDLDASVSDIITATLFPSIFSSAREPSFIARHYRATNPATTESVYTSIIDMASSLEVSFKRVLKDNTLSTDIDFVSTNGLESLRNGINILQADILESTDLAQYVGLGIDAVALAVVVLVLLGLQFFLLRRAFNTVTLHQAENINVFLHIDRDVVDEMVTATNVAKRDRKRKTKKTAKRAIHFDVANEPEDDEHSHITDARDLARMDVGHSVSQVSIENDDTDNEDAGSEFENTPLPPLPDEVQELPEDEETDQASHSEANDHNTTGSAHSPTQSDNSDEDSDVPTLSFGNIAGRGSPTPFSMPKQGLAFISAESVEIASSVEDGHTSNSDVDRLTPYDDAMAVEDHLLHGDDGDVDVEQAEHTLRRAKVYHSSLYSITRLIYWGTVLFLAMAAAIAFGVVVSFAYDAVEIPIIIDAFNDLDATQRLITDLKSADSTQTISAVEFIQRGTVDAYERYWEVPDSRTKLDLLNTLAEFDLSVEDATLVAEAWDLSDQIAYRDHVEMKMRWMTLDLPDAVGCQIMDLDYNYSAETWHDAEQAVYGDYRASSGFYSTNEADSAMNATALETSARAVSMDDQYWRRKDQAVDNLNEVRNTLLTRIDNEATELSDILDTVFTVRIIATAVFVALSVIVLFDILVLIILKHRLKRLADRIDQIRHRLIDSKANHHDERKTTKRSVLIIQGVLLVGLTLVSFTCIAIAVYSTFYQHSQKTTLRDKLLEKSDISTHVYDVLDDWTDYKQLSRRYTQRPLSNILTGIETAYTALEASVALMQEHLGEYDIQPDTLAVFNDNIDQNNHTLMVAIELMLWAQDIPVTVATEFQDYEYDITAESTYEFDQMHYTRQYLYNNSVVDRTLTADEQIKIAREILFDDKFHENVVTFEETLFVYEEDAHGTVEIVIDSAASSMTQMEIIVVVCFAVIFVCMLIQFLLLLTLVPTPARKLSVIRQRVSAKATQRFYRMAAATLAALGIIFLILTLYSELWFVVSTQVDILDTSASRAVRFIGVAAEGIFTAFDKADAKQRYNAAVSNLAVMEDRHAIITSESNPFVTGLNLFLGDEYSLGTAITCPSCSVLTDESYSQAISMFIDAIPELNPDNGFGTCLAVDGINSQALKAIIEIEQQVTPVFLGTFKDYARTISTAMLAYRLINVPLYIFAIGFLLLSYRLVFQKIFTALSRDESIVLSLLVMIPKEHVANNMMLATFLAENAISDNSN
ncbi:Sodium/glucose cotransporter [Carpediemonas membranifera]|uniref:Sodium/glucose cotransporter n=1 Tax=Carpediemonas membranifera TaxID=201153 RepID=A0A8J6AXZ8_9EUKA|nr:Sodium/glucose cotransporter [Carpediemonas membranifera]|eukprot:KAG9390004.1 Sodium/glucose cotransporter [Carpediemonas membranifera]